MSNENLVMSDESTDEVASVDLAKEYLAFVSDGLHFIVSASNIIEIIMRHSITRLPKVPDFIKGIINLRGQIIPIIDVRLRMNKPDIEYNEEACVIVINVHSVLIGLLVESVSHVISIDSKDIAPVPAKNKQELVNGIARVNDLVYLLLDCDLIVRQEI